MRYGQRRIVSNSTATRVSVKKLVSAFYSALQSEPAEETLGESVKKLKSAFYSALQSDPAEETPGEFVKKLVSAFYSALQSEPAVEMMDGKNNPPPRKYVLVHLSIQYGGADQH